MDLLCQPQLHPLPLADLLDLCPAVAAAESGRRGEMRLGGREKKMSRVVSGRHVCPGTYVHQFSTSPMKISG
jgi:hypothetical protein